MIHAIASALRRDDAERQHRSGRDHRCMRHVVAFGQWAFWLSRSGARDAGGEVTVYSAE